jgi:hypothetical protein
MFELTPAGRKALLKSIEHWHCNLDMLILNYLSGSYSLEDDIRISGDDCALCHLYRDCKSCPISEDQGRHCRGTPYYSVQDWMLEPRMACTGCTREDYREGYRVISAMLEYLYSVLYRG